MNKHIFIVLLSLFSFICHADKIPQDGGIKGEMQTNDIIGEPAINPALQTGKSTIQDDVSQQNNKLEQEAKQLDKAMQKKVDDKAIPLSKPQL
jgi:hypothetical protein